MLIPRLVINILAGTVLAVFWLGLIAALVFTFAKLADLLFQSAKIVMLFFGMWTAFFNYLQVVQHAASGGKDWLTLLSPQNQIDDPRRNERIAAHYFKVHPRPECWRWWMRCLGIKKPAQTEA